MSVDIPDEIYDVVVVGGGAVGLAAAIEARKLGRQVLLLEKNPALGPEIRFIAPARDTLVRLLPPWPALVFGRIAGRNAIQSV
jgi:flavin-dependent dehydrogenase